MAKRALKNHQQPKTIIKQEGGYAIIRYAEYLHQYYYMGEHTYYYDVKVMIVRIDADGVINERGAVTGSVKKLKKDFEKIVKLSQKFKNVAPINLVTMVPTS